jgi:hypothetical protein
VTRNIQYAAFVFLTTAAMSSFAGEIHEGNGSSRESACEAADRRAEKAATKKGTCATTCELSSCRKESDGSFTCIATSANHRGSCSR